MLEVTIPRGHPILAPMTLRIRRGDRLCLLGPSGTGKTTLLNHLAGLEPDQGRPALRIGYLFQEHRLLPWRTLSDNLRLVGVRREAVAPLLARVGLADCADHYPDQLSLGMARRAALARCLAIRPDLLLLDEPFASLDPQRAQALQGLIRELLDQAPEMAMLCVTHEVRDVAALANRVWYLKGRPASLHHDERLTPGDEALSGLARRLEALGRRAGAPSGALGTEQASALGAEAADRQQ